MRSLRWRRALITQLALSILLLLCDGSAYAADYYVRPNGGTYGAENGADWNNAFDGFSNIAWSNVNAGDTIWVAGGNYTQDLIPASSGTAANRISIQRARTDATPCTGAAGWSAAFATTVHQIRQGITFTNVNYVTVSGRTTAAGGSYGWWIDFQGATAGTGIKWPNGSTSSNIVVEYFRIQGPGVITYTADGRGIDDTPFSSATNHTFRAIAIHDWESAVYVAGMSNPTFEYIDIYDIWAINFSTFHPNGIYTSLAPGGIVRHSRFHRGPKGNAVGEGIFFEQVGGSTDWQIYGNVFYDLNEGGKKAIQITSNVGNIKVFNNTFDDLLVPAVFLNGPEAACGSGAEVRNNLGFAAVFSTEISCGTESDNLVVSSTSVWVNRTGRDYHIVSTTGAGFPRDAGIALTPNGAWERDPDGTVRGSDGRWDIGAFEFPCTPCPPRAPSNVRIIR